MHIFFSRHPWLNYEDLHNAYMRVTKSFYFAGQLETAASNKMLPSLFIKSIVLTLRPNLSMEQTSLFDQWLNDPGILQVPNESVSHKNTLLIAPTWQGVLDYWFHLSWESMVACPTKTIFGMAIIISMRIRFGWAHGCNFYFKLCSLKLYLYVDPMCTIGNERNTMCPKWK